MKTKLLSIQTLSIFVITLLSGFSFGQGIESNYMLNFEDEENTHVTIDLASNPENVWQIGTPGKAVFTEALSVPRAIVTDTAETYPTGDTSVFYITNIHYGGGFSFGHTVTLRGAYQVDSDTLTDFGTIELSPDQGMTWIDLVNDELYESSIYWNSPKPVFSGNSGGWQHFDVNFAALGAFFNVAYGDTILYRFTFISDAVETGKDGLMFDNIVFQDYVEGIEELQNDDLVSVFPNPAKNVLHIERTMQGGEESIKILNAASQVEYENQHFSGNQIDISGLQSGIYFLRYSDSKSFAVKRFVVR